MTDRDTSFRTGVDRMDHPLSHTAAVVAGVALVALAGCAALLLSDRRMLRSPSWWAAAVLAGSVVSACTVGYVRPRSPAIYVPVLLAGSVTLGLCAWHGWWALHPAGRVHPANGLYQSLAFFAAWLGWAGRTVRHLRAARRAE